jgi:hypothetical protein
MSDSQSTKPRRHGVPEGAFALPQEGLKVKLKGASTAEPKAAQQLASRDSLSSSSPKEEGDESENYSCPCLFSLKPFWDGVATYFTDCWKSLCDWIGSFSAQAAPKADADAASSMTTEVSRPAEPGQPGSLGAFVKANKPAQVTKA